MDLINNFFLEFSTGIWNLVSILVIGGGILFFTYLIESDIFSRLNPIQYFKHALAYFPVNMIALMIKAKLAISKLWLPHYQAQLV